MLATKRTTFATPVSWRRKSSWPTGKASTWVVSSKSRRYWRTNRSPGITIRRRRDATRLNTTQRSTSKLPNEDWLWFRWTKLTEGDTTAIWAGHFSVVTTLRWMRTGMNWWFSFYDCRLRSISYNCLFLFRLDALHRTRAMTIRKSTPTGATSSRSTNRPWRPGRRNKQ